LHQIRELADRMRSVLVAGDLDTFGQLLHDSWQAKKRVSQKISNSHIDQMYAAARANGAIGGKITGAGGGGFLLLFCPREKQASVREAVTVLGGRGMQFELDFQGAQVLVNDPFVDGDEKGGMRWIFQSISTGVQIA